MSTEVTPNATLRELAVGRLKKQAEFRLHALIYLLVNGFLVVIWWMTGMPFFWPVFPLVAWGIGVVANAVDAYGRDAPSESRILEEMERLQHRA